MESAKVGESVEKERRPKKAERSSVRDIMVTPFGGRAYIDWMIPRRWTLRAVVIS